jgi:hypothetical protein
MVKMEKPEQLEPIFRLGKGTPQEQAKDMAKSITETEQNKATPQPSIWLFGETTLVKTQITYSPKDRTVGIDSFIKRVR